MVSHIKLRDGTVDIIGDALNANVDCLVMKVGSKLLFQTPDLIITLPGGKQVRRPSSPIDVMQTIQNLQAQVAQLQERVAALEAR